MPDLPFVVTPSTFTSHSPDEIRAMVDDKLPEIVTLLTRGGGNAAAAPAPAPAAHETALEFTADDGIRAVEAMNERFLELGWGDGFPLYPPTADRVAAMLRGTRRAPDSVVAVLEPGFGIATVETIAANAVMAGCKPEHLPVLIAAIECIAEPAMGLRTKAMSTGPQAPMIVVNGPIRQRIGLNSGRNALGPGAPSKVNTAIGRALRLCMMNIGHTYPDIGDMDTIGSPTKYSMCLAENEEVSPWDPLQTEHGFARDQSTVTVHFNYGLTELHDFESHTPEDLIEVFVSAAQNTGAVTTGFWLTGRRAEGHFGLSEQEHDLILVCPEHAEIFGKAGWTKDRLRTEIHKRARLPFKTLMHTKQAKSFNAAHPELAWLWDSPDTLVPVLEDEKCYDIVVVGATAGRSQMWWGCGATATKVVEE
ncbi:MAG: hypothetical protein KGJ98_00020 [Chloroflexota bacterium]|nr:hypothetical protein [Chloroflexota bacterium]MDE3100598.1 hypothetical protein [Chloroflexota bacterium]